MLNQTQLRFVLKLVIIICVAFVTAKPALALTPANLKVEYRANPLGIDLDNPRLSWVVTSEQRDQIQSAYQIIVASSSEKLRNDQGDLWDSGKISSDKTLNIVYAGKGLSSGQRAFWKVRVWDGQNKPSAFSEPAFWEMALKPQDWKAKWITRKTEKTLTDEEMFGDNPAPLFRKEFKLEKKIARARVYVTGLGYYELYLNGKRVGDHVLDPGWTTYSKRVLYSTYDVTDMLQKGSNAAGILVGNGWFNPLPLAMWNKFNPRHALTIGEPRAIAQIVIEFADGTKELVCTDESWKVGESPILRNSVYLGEFYDARKEQPGWDKPGFSDSAWSNAILATQSLGPLCPQSAPPIRITRKIKPVKVTEPKPGVFIFDMGQNFAGWVTLRVKGEAGTRVRLRNGELLYPDGTLNAMTAVCGQLKAGGPQYVYSGSGKPKTAFQLDEYTLKGQGQEVYTPRFTFHGFRYVEVTGLPSTPGLDCIEGLRLNSDVQSAGSFACSNELFNRIQEMVLWTELSNLFGVQSDCPHREKFGYGGDIVASSEMGIFNFGMETFYAKAVEDLADAVRPNGGFTETAPFVGIADDGLGEKSGPIGWGTAHPHLVWQLYQYYGNDELLRQQYEAVKKWIALLKASATNGILENGLSDHESLVPKPRALTGTAFYYYNVQLFSKIARVLGNESDATEADLLAKQIITAFNQKFLKAGGQYDSGTQACQAFALHMKLAPEDIRSASLECLVRDVAQHENHLTTGIFGTKFMLNALTDAGRADVAYSIVNQKTFPGWGHMLENGATTLWEHWQFSDNTYSHNHPMFGSVSEWFYKALAGIRPAKDAIGFDQIVVYPQPVGDLKWVKASYDSVRGIIISEWKREGNAFELVVQIPANTTATVVVPSANPRKVMESGTLLENAGFNGVKFPSGCAICSVGSGTYRFKSELK